MESTTKGADMTLPLIDRPEYLRTLKPGQRVLASFNGEKPHLGVVSDGFSYGTIAVQFSPCGAHFRVRRASAHGDANGWTEREYRVEREDASTIEHARAVEAERREKYPDAPFSPAFA